MAKKQAPKITTGAALRDRARVLLTVPDSGNTYRVREPDIEDVIKTGVLPNNFTAKTLLELGKMDNSELTDEDLLKDELVRRSTVTAALLEPRVVEKLSDPPDPMETLYKDIPRDDREYIRLWATRRLPEMPVELSSGGYTSVKALENFSSKQEVSEPSGVSVGSREGGRESVAEVGASG